MDIFIRVMCIVFENYTAYSDSKPFPLYTFEVSAVLCEVDIITIWCYESRMYGVKNVFDAYGNWQKKARSEQKKK